jgi:hypothetical protein
MIQELGRQRNWNEKWWPHWQIYLILKSLKEKVKKALFEKSKWWKVKGIMDSNRLEKNIYKWEAKDG